jgi:hypothetical protein
VSVLIEYTVAVIPSAAEGSRFAMVPLRSFDFAQDDEGSAQDDEVFARDDDIASVRDFLPYPVNASTLSKYPGNVLATQPGSRIRTPGARNPVIAKLIAIR